MLLKLPDQHRHPQLFYAPLLLQNMLLKEFIREGLASRSLGPEEARRLSRLEAINAMELARWEKDLLGGGSGSSPGSSRERV